MPTRDGHSWPQDGVRRGWCSCDTCRELEAARTYATAAAAIRRHHPEEHFQLETLDTLDGPRFTAYAIVPASDAEESALAAGIGLAGCWCARCVPTLPPDPSLPAVEWRFPWRTAPVSGPQDFQTPTPEPAPMPPVQPTEEPEEEPTEERTECVGCGSMVPEEDVYRCGWRDRPYCESCSFSCAECDERQPTSYAYTVRVPRWGGGTREQLWCGGCYDDTWRCGECEAAFSNAIEHHTEGEDDDWFCEPCWQRVHNGYRAVFGIGGYHNADRKRETRPITSPWSKAHGGRLFGVELEAERHGDADAPLLRLVDPLLVAANKLAPWSAQGRLLWAERDGSLANGAELITAPAGLDVQRDLWRTVLACPEVRGLRSHDTSTCGLHVHISRPGDWLTAKLAQWVALPALEELVRLVARRYGSSYAQMTPRRLCRTTAHHGSRYEAVNTTNSATVELRIFRGSLRPQTVLGAVEFAHAACAYVEDTSARHLTMADTAERFVRRIHAPDLLADTVHLRALMAARTAEAPTRAPRITAALAALPRKTKRTPAAAACPTTETED